MARPGIICSFLSIITVLVGFSVGTAQASSITYITPPGSTINGNPVDASATFTTGTGTIRVTLDNLEANPKDLGQSLSDLFFTVSNGFVGLPFRSGSATAISINSSGMITTTAPLTTAGAIGWVLRSGAHRGTFILSTGLLGPAHTIIGPPNASDVYSNADSSIAGNGPHNPFISETATWVIDALPDTTINSAVFSFGTTTVGVGIAGIVTPEPSSLLLFGTGLLPVIGVIRRRYLNR